MYIHHINQDIIRFRESRRSGTKLEKKRRKSGNVQSRSLLVMVFHADVFRTWDPAVRALRQPLARPNRRRSIIITAPASIMKVRARVSRIRVRACRFPRAPGFAGWLHSGTGGGRDPMGRTGSAEGTKGAGVYNEGGFRGVHDCVSAPLSHALKRNA